MTHRTFAIGYVKRLSLSAIAATLVFHAGATCASTAKYAGEFLAIGVGGRALGMGGAYSAVTNDVTAGYWNPAGLSLLEYPQLSLMHDERFAGLENYDYAGFALPVNASSTLGFSIIRSGVDNIVNTQNAWVDLNHDGVPESDEIDTSKISFFNAADWAFYLSYAKRVNDNFSYGANLKFIRREDGDATATGVGFDAAVLYRPAEHIRLAATLQDITTTLVAWNSGTNELISPTVKLGSAYILKALDGEICPALDVDVRFENRQFASNAHLGAMSFDFHEGLEYTYRDLVAFRVGHGDIGPLNLGAGIHLPKFDIDYSFQKYNAIDQIGNTHRISITFTLAAPQFARAHE